MSFLSSIGSAVTKNIGSAVSPAAIASKVKNLIAGPDTTLGKLLPAVTSLPTVLANTKTKVVEVTKQAAANAVKKAINSKLGNGSAAPAASEEGAVASEEGAVASEEGAVASEEGAESYTNVVGANSGEGNAGEGNAGEGNAGEGNAGEGNTGEGNAGEGNAGEGNSGEGNTGEEQEGGRRKTRRRRTRHKKRKNKSKNRRKRRSRVKKLA
jgi:hypothetical protein